MQQNYCSKYYLCIYQIKQQFFVCQLIRRTIRGFLVDSKVRDLKNIGLNINYRQIPTYAFKSENALSSLESYLMQPQVAIGALKDNIYMFFRLPKQL